MWEHIYAYEYYANVRHDTHIRIFNCRSSSFFLFFATPISIFYGIHTTQIILMQQHKLHPKLHGEIKEGYFLFYKDKLFHYCTYDGSQNRQKARNRVEPDVVHSEETSALLALFNPFLFLNSSLFYFCRLYVGTWEFFLWIKLETEENCVFTKKKENCK